MRAPIIPACTISKKRHAPSIVMGSSALVVDQTFDDDGSLWLAGTHGIYPATPRQSCCVQHNERRPRIAFYERPGGDRTYGGNFSIRHENRGHNQGILQRSDLLDHSPIRFAPIGGGLNLCVIINKEDCKQINLAQKQYAVVDRARPNRQRCILGTQEGLYRVNAGSDRQGPMPSA